MFPAKGIHVTSTLSAPASSDSSEGTPEPRAVFNQLNAVLKSGNALALTEPGARVGDLVTKKVEIVFSERFDITVEAQSSNDSGRSTLVFTLEKTWTGSRSDDSAATFTIVRAPLPPGRKVPFYRGRNRDLKVLNILLELLGSDRTIIPSKVDDDLLRDAATRAGVNPPSDKTCAIARAVLAELYRHHAARS